MVLFIDSVFIAFILPENGPTSLLGFIRGCEKYYWISQNKYPIVFINLFSLEYFDEE
jgi:hypothetical protein